MSIKKLEEIREEFRVLPVAGTTIIINNFMQETIQTFKDQSDMIADLQKELAKKMKEIDQKKSYYPKNGRR